ncbi:vWA domain-containing protein [Actinomadura sp. HBU206391]|uniref:vWA domain-containing protein n=1 Tax=Actinomadura sp. HBU206391 TaxID=2731692 RepID=UPI00164F21B3|nr:VWA domain-containing protein [Actinomadura sp. HBU206391]MBC6460573.1 VWA domain-containing protein [Actinomadura sp. HBU206391]
MRLTARTGPFATAMRERRPRTAGIAGRLIALAGAVLAGLTMIPMQPLAATARAGAPEGSEKLAPIMLVLDASGSMAARAPGGTKMDAAKRAVRSVVDTVPANGKMGLMVYGTGTGSAPGDKAAGCKDIKMVHPVGTLDKAAITRAANAFEPRGYTPIGQSLRAAAAALSKDGPRSIVLVSDGEDTCAPPEPCEVATELAKQGIDLRIHTVGFQVEAKAKKELTCIAQVTGGTYTNVPKASELGRALGRVTQSALRNYQAAGTRVIGTPTLQGAPVIKPGAYQDTLDNAKRYYSVDIPAGNTAYFAATVPFERGGSVQVKGLNVALLGVNGTDCNFFENEITTSGYDGRPLTVELTWEGLVSPSRTPYPDCKKPGRYTFVVYYTGATDRPAGGGGEQLPLELLVGLEPPAGDKGPEPAGKPVAFQDPGGPERPVTGGASFGTAAALPGSGRYTEQLNYGEFLFYKVRLDWGQALTYRVRYPDDPNIRLAVNIESEMYAPSRRVLAWDTTFYSGQAKMLDAPNLAAKSGGFSTLPIRYRNRELRDAKLNAHSVAGWYYFAVKLGRHNSESEKPNPIPVTMDVSVVGSPEKGPRYTGATGQTDTFGAPPAEPSAAIPPLTGRKVSSESGLPWSTIVTAVTGAIAVALIGTLLFTRRRRTAPHLAPASRGQLYTAVPGILQHTAGPGMPSDTPGPAAPPYSLPVDPPPQTQGTGAPANDLPADTPPYDLPANAPSYDLPTNAPPYNLPPSPPPYDLPAGAPAGDLPIGAPAYDLGPGTQPDTSEPGAPPETPGTGVPPHTSEPGTPPRSREPDTPFGTREPETPPHTRGPDTPFGPPR